MSDAAGSGVQAILFDLGGVLVDFGGVEGLARLLPAPLSPAEIDARWQRCPHSLAFGSGTLDEAGFTEAFMRDWGIAMPPEAFAKTYRSWARGWLPGARELLDALRPRVRLAALSNSNPLHWQALLEDAGLAADFEFMLSSHEVGARKPARAMYDAALARFDLPPGAVLFLDDAQGNVDAARALGLQAERVDGVEGVRRVVRARHLLPES